MFKIIITLIIFTLSITFCYADLSFDKKSNLSMENNLNSIKKGSNIERINNIEKRKAVIDWIKKNYSKKRKELVDEMKKDFNKKKQELIKEYKDWNISLKEAKSKLLEERKSQIETWKKKIEEEKLKVKNERLEKLKSKIRGKIEVKLEKYNNLDTEKKVVIYEKILLKINDWLENLNLSDKQKLLYNILKDIFNDFIDEIKK